MENPQFIHFFKKKLVQNNHILPLQLVSSALYVDANVSTLIDQSDKSKIIGKTASEIEDSLKTEVVMLGSGGHQFMKSPSLLDGFAELSRSRYLLFPNGDVDKTVSWKLGF